MTQGGSAFSGPGRPVRWRAALLAGAIELAVVVGIVHALGFDPVAPVTKPLSNLSVFTSDPPPPPPPPPPHADSKAAGKAAPPAKREKAAPVLAAPVPLPTHTVPAAPVPGVGVAPRNGAALAGPGSGAGGAGNGTGSGGSGNGDGAGGEEPELTKGRIDDRDYPYEAFEQRAHGMTRTEITVSEQGRPTGCRVLKSSGFAILDDLTCKLALKRFRFKPARDDSGRAIPGSVYYEQDWQLGRTD